MKDGKCIGNDMVKGGMIMDVNENNDSVKGMAGCIRKVSNLERAFIWKPNSNVSMIASIKGNVSEEKLRAAIDKVRQMHPLVGARIVFDEDHNAWFSTDKVPSPKFKTFHRLSDTQWFEELQCEIQIPFDLKTGPMIRFILLYSEKVSDLVIICSHSICDGMALAYLVRDLLNIYLTPEHEIKVLFPPNNRDFLPEVDFSSSPDLTKIIDYANTEWNKNPYYFNSEDYTALYKAYWEKNEFGTVILELDSQETEILSKICKEKGVTVGSAVSAAFMAAHQDIIGPFLENQNEIMVPYDLRRHAVTPIGDVFCLCVGAPQFPYVYNAKKSFWENASILQEEIHKRVEKLEYSDLANPGFDPSFIDALSSFVPFKKIIPDAYIRTENLSRFSQDTKNIAFLFAEKSEYNIPGTVPSNLGQLKIPEIYGNLQIERIIFIPAVIDHIPLILGGVTIGGRMVFSLSYPEPKDNNGSMTQEMIHIRNKALEYLGFPDKISKMAII